MSAIACAWADEFGRRLPDRERVLLRMLADYAAPDGTGVYPYVETLADRLGWNVRKVQRGVARLLALGVLAVDTDAPVPDLLRYQRPDRRPRIYCLPDLARGDTRGDTRGDRSVANGVTDVSPLYIGTKNRNNHTRGDTRGDTSGGHRPTRTPPTCPVCQLLHYPTAVCDGPPVLVSVPTSKPRRPYRGNRYSPTAGKRRTG